MIIIKNTKKGFNIKPYIIVKEVCMRGLFASIVAAVGLVAAGIGSQACSIFILDEPETPASLIK